MCILYLSDICFLQKYVLSSIVLQEELLTLLVLGTEKVQVSEASPPLIYNIEAFCSFLEFPLIYYYSTEHM